MPTSPADNIRGLLDGILAWDGTAPKENAVLDLYRAAAERGAAPTLAEAQAAFAALPSAFARSMVGPWREAVIREVGFGLPCAEVIERFAAAGPILEIGTGTGLWSLFLASAGCDVLAIDDGSGRYAAPADDGKDFAPLASGRWHPVRQGDGVDAVRSHPERTVLMVWPDSGSSAAEQIAAALPAGSLLLHAGEVGGCTGTPAFAQALHVGFVLDWCHPLPTWGDLRDDARIYRKIR